MLARDRFAFIVESSKDNATLTAYLLPMVHGFKVPPRLIHSLLGASLALSASAQFPGAEAPPADLEKGYKAISIQEATNWLTFLSTQCDGRGSGQPGFQKAADYMAARFKEMGLVPAGDNGTYFQQVPYARTMVNKEGSSVTVGTLSLPVGDTLGLSGFMKDVDASLDLVVLRVPNGTDEVPPTLNLKGKAVMVVGDPSFTFLRNVNKAGPGLVITPADSIPESRMVEAFGRQLVPSAKVTADVAKQLLAKVGVDAGWLDTDAKFDWQQKDAQDKVHVVAKVTGESRGVPNVVGILPGSDPVLKNEYVGIGAHLDHLGKTDQGVIYPGADDDGSGSTALLCVMKAFKNSTIRPKRTILFMAFCGEEKGLIGSGYLANHPVVPLDKMICELQMDMVARNSYGAQNGDPNRMDVEAENKDTIRLVGSKRIATGLDALIQQMNKYVGFKFKYDAEDVYTRSDHYNFAAKGIPIAFLFDGFTPDYHQPGDTVDKINFLKLTNAAKLYYMVALEAANQPKAFDHDVKQ